MVALGLPWNRQILSIAMPVIGAAWVAEGIFLRKLPRIQKFLRKEYLLASAMFLPYLIGLLWTQEMEWGGRLVAIVLPLLLYPFYFAVMPPLRRVERNGLLLLFVSTTAIVSLWSYALASSAGTNEFRDYSPIISHIRLALMACLCIAICLWFIVRLSTKLKWFLLLPATWFFYYLSVLASIQGFFILFLLLLIALWTWKQDPRGRLVGRLVAVVLVALGTYFVVDAYQQYASAEPLPADARTEKTVNGERYQHGEGPQSAERGMYVWHYVAINELRREWGQRSSLDFDGKDRSGTDLKHTLCRYLNSKGLRKDSAAMATLSALDISRIEQGIAWYDHGERNAVLERFDMVFFELDTYFNKGYSQGSSVAMRLVYWSTGWSIFKEHPWFGVGTGDTQLAYDQAYELAEHPLPKVYRLRAHQQLLTWLISWGVIGFLFMCVAMIYPMLSRWKYRHPLFLSFLVILGVSFLSDDTLERQIGATLFAFFYGLLLLVPNVEQGSNDTP